MSWFQLPACLMLEIGIGASQPVSTPIGHASIPPGGSSRSKMASYAKNGDRHRFSHGILLVTAQSNHLTVF